MMNSCIDDLEVFKAKAHRFKSSFYKSCVETLPPIITMDKGVAELRTGAKNNKEKEIDKPIGAVLKNYFSEP